MNRRAALRLLGVAGLAALGGGCVAAPRRTARAGAPAPIYPKGYAPVTAPPAMPAAPVAAAAARPAVIPPPPPVPAGTIRVIPRTAWTDARLASGNVYPMAGVTRITVHHTGGNPHYDTSLEGTVRALQSIKGGHVGRGWADIGYHFVIDRAGRVIEGRPMAYQGAHVAENNEHNLGIMLLGNFERQSPTAAQLTALQAFTRAMLQQCRVAPGNLKTHQEFMPTACPGRSLQGWMVTARRQRAFG